MKARLATWASLWMAASCLPQSDDLGVYSAEWTPVDVTDETAGGASSLGGSSNLAPTDPDSDGSAGTDGVVGGGSLPLDGMGGAVNGPASGQGGASSNAGAGAAGAPAGAPALPPEPAAPCADGTLSPDEATCYRVFLSALAWDDARDECVAWQGELAKVETPEEDAFLGTLLSRSIWLGASDTVTENVFQWTDGTPVTFGVWGPNQPDRYPGADCVEKRDTLGRLWFDQPCFNERAFVCEKPLEP
jgi:hypothetical protein